MARYILSIATLTLLLMACSQRPTPPDEPLEISAAANAPGDSTLYGLACDGCTDSVLVVLPRDCSDPDTFDIINARHGGKIFGRPRIGDELAVVVNPEDPEEVLMAIDIDNMLGQWCYMAEPRLRNIEQMPQRIQRRMMERMPDSVRERLLVPREYGIRLKRSNLTQVTGLVRRQTTTDDMSPIEYDEPARYTEWHLYNGHLLLVADNILPTGEADSTKAARVDTADIVLLMRDSLVLRIGENTQSFYRKK